jgi:hypothetical protein
MNGGSRQRAAASSSKRLNAIGTLLGARGDRSVRRPEGALATERRRRRAGMTEKGDSRLPVLALPLLPASCSLLPPF